MVTRSGGRPRAAEIVIATEGQRLLVECREGVSELARRLGVTPQCVENWRSGRRKPGPDRARRLLELVGIPLDAWARKPGASAATSPAPAGPSTRTPTSLEEVDEMLASLRQTAGLTDKEVQKRIAERVRLLGLKAKIEYQDKLAEDAIVRAHPHWAEIKRVLRDALEPYPEALAAVHERLAAIGAWEAARHELEGAHDHEDGS